MENFKNIMESWRKFSTKNSKILSEGKSDVRRMGRIQKRLFDKLDTTMVDNQDLKSLGTNIPLKNKLQKLQMFLFRKGFFDGVAQKLGREKLKTFKTGKFAAGSGTERRYHPDGVYGSETIEAIKNLQKAMGFVPPEKYRPGINRKIDGLFGNDTIDSLGVRQQLAAKGIPTINNVGAAPNKDDAERDTIKQRENLKIHKKKFEDATRKVQQVALSKFDIQMRSVPAAERTEEDDKKRRDLFVIKNALAFLGPDNQIVKNYNFHKEKYNKFSKLASEDPMMEPRRPKSLDKPKNNPKKGEFSGRTVDKALSNAGIPRDKPKGSTKP